MGRETERNPATGAQTGHSPCHLVTVEMQKAKTDACGKSDAAVAVASQHELLYSSPVSPHLLSALPVIVEKNHNVLTI